VCNVVLSANFPKKKGKEKLSKRGGGNSMGKEISGDLAVSGGSPKNKSGETKGMARGLIENRKRGRERRKKDKECSRHVDIGERKGGQVIRKGGC